MEIEVSYLSSKYDSVTTINKIENTNANYIHVDIMDGVFVENKTAPIKEVIELLKNTNKLLDIHLMVSHIENYIEQISILKPEYITFHIELSKQIDLNKMIELVKEKNIKVGLAVNPATDITEINPYIAKTDQVLVMSVLPGKGGQKFISEVLPKLAYLNQLKHDYNFVINVDGGVNKETIKLLKDYNPDLVVSGSFICQSDNYQKQLDLLK